MALIESNLAARRRDREHAARRRRRRSGGAQAQRGAQAVKGWVVLDEYAAYGLRLHHRRHILFFTKHGVATEGPWCMHDRSASNQQQVQLGVNNEDTACTRRAVDGLLYKVALSQVE